jgi:hypothetical protein
MPEPPAEQLDFAKIGGPEVQPAMNVITAIGQPGAGPPGHVLRVTNLDDVQAPSDVVIADDGSFEISVPGENGDELRFHTRDGRERDEPIDVIWNYGFTLSERIDCVTLTPPLQRDYGLVEVGGTPVINTVVLRNECAETVQVTAVRFRTAAGDYSFEASNPVPPVDVVPDDTRAWYVVFSPAQIGDSESIVFVEVTTPEGADRYPITVFGDGT